MRLRWGSPWLTVTIVIAVLLNSGCFPTRTRTVKPEYLLSYQEMLGPTGQPEDDYSVVFTSDDSLAILIGAGVCRLLALERHGASWKVTGSAVTCGGLNQIYAVAGRDVLVKLGDQNRLYSPDLKTSKVLPIQIVVASSTSGSNTIGEYRSNSWTIYHLLPELQKVRSGPGELLSVSDELVAFRDGNNINTEALDGATRGSFQPGVRYAKDGEIIDDNRLLRTTNSGQIVTTLHGRQIASLPTARGSGVRHGWSADHHRILYDQFTRIVPALQRSGEILLTLFTLGVGAPNESPNGELVQMLDVATGRVCFTLESPSQLLGRAYDYHADISPSGRSVAVLSKSGLALYRVSDCPGS